MQKFVPLFSRLTGLVLIVVGLVAAYYGPLEIHVFYLFSEGGQFHYPGFRIGTFWFAALVVQNIGYYVVAAFCIPVGIGYVRLRRWALTLTRLALWFWLGAGILLLGNLLFLIPAFVRLDLGRELPFTQLVARGITLLVTLILIPVLALVLAKSDLVRLTFEKHDPKRYWTENYPFPLLALLLLFAIMIGVMHVSMFFQSLFPMFGQIMLGRPSVYIVALCILITGILIYGTVRLDKWAWWGSLGYLFLLTLSSVLSFSRYSFSDIILMMNLPEFEIAFLDGMTLLHDFRLVGLIAPPLLMALGLIVYSKRYFSSPADRTQADRGSS